MSMMPGKGAHLDCTQKSMAFLLGTMTEVLGYYNEAGGDENIDEGNGLKFVRGLSEQEGWSLEKDNFGVKVYKSIPWGNDEYRVTVVHNSRGEIKLDVRVWYEK